MITVKFDSKTFKKEMENLMRYSEGFLEGVQIGKKQLLDNLGRDVLTTMKLYIDSNARVNPQALHHVYEWYQTGSPNARLFDITYTVSNLGLSFKSTFSQSKSVKDGSYEPFYNKAKIMEEGIPVVIKPKRAEALRFDVNGEEIFTKNPVKVENPGGQVEGQYERVFDQFFSKYFTQAFLKSSGILEQFKNPVVYKRNLKSGKIGSRTKGVQTGYMWVANIKAVG